MYNHIDNDIYYTCMGRTVLNILVVIIVTAKSNIVTCITVVYVVTSYRYLLPTIKTNIFIDSISVDFLTKKLLEIFFCLFKL